MSIEWLRLPIFVNGERRCDSNSEGELTVPDAYERMNTVFSEIEQTRAEGRMMSTELFSALDDLEARLSNNDPPSFADIAQLITDIGKNYRLDPVDADDSPHLRVSKSGECTIWIDQKKLTSVFECNLHSYYRNRGGAWWRFW